MEMVQVSIAPPIKIAASPLDPTQGSERLSTEIANFAPVEGWLCYQSAVIEVRDGAVPKPGDGRGLILSGELINAAWESLHIRQNGRGGWLLTRFTPDRGETYLADEHRFVVHAPTQGYTSAPAICATAAFGPWARTSAIRGKASASTRPASSALWRATEMAEPRNQNTQRRRPAGGGGGFRPGAGRPERRIEPGPCPDSLDVLKSRFEQIPAPYNFVPLAPWVHVADSRRLVSLDMPFRDGACGEIPFTLVADTPILIGAEQDKPRPGRTAPARSIS